MLIIRVRSGRSALYHVILQQRGNPNLPNRALPNLPFSNLQIHPISWNSSQLTFYQLEFPNPIHHVRLHERSPPRPARRLRPFSRRAQLQHLLLSLGGPYDPHRPSGRGARAAGHCIWTGGYQICGGQLDWPQDGPPHQLVPCLGLPGGWSAGILA